MNIYTPKVNWNPQGKSLEPKGIVLHSMLESLGGKDAWTFLHIDQGLSVHACITEDTSLFDEQDMDEFKLEKGQPTIVECQDTFKVAYHAGKSRYKSLTNLNYHFLGVEVLVKLNPYLVMLNSRKITNKYSQFKYVINHIDWLKSKQFDLLVDWCVIQMKEYDIQIENVVRHSDVSGDDVRGVGKGKVDIGNSFDRYTFYKQLQTKLTGNKPDDKWVKELINHIDGAKA